MYGPHEDSDIIFGPVRHFGWTLLVEWRATTEPELFVSSKRSTLRLLQNQTNASPCACSYFSKCVVMFV